MFWTLIRLITIGSALFGLFATGGNAQGALVGLGVIGLPLIALTVLLRWALLPLGRQLLQMNRDS